MATELVGSRSMADPTGFPHDGQKDPFVDEEEASQPQPESPVLPAAQNNSLFAVTVSAMTGGMAEKVLLALSRAAITDKYQRSFGEWNLEPEGVRKCYGYAGVEDGSFVSVRLVIGRQEGVFIEDVSGSSKWRPCSLGTTGNYTVQVGAKVPPGRIENITQQLTAWLVRGSSWKNRFGAPCSRPYGSDPARR